jgi:hypothetical protein
MVLFDFQVPRLAADTGTVTSAEDSKCHARHSLTYEMYEMCFHLLAPKLRDVLGEQNCQKYQSSIEGLKARKIMTRPCFRTRAEHATLIGR